MIIARLFRMLIILTLTCNLPALQISGSYVTSLALQKLISKKKRRRVSTL